MNKSQYTGEQIVVLEGLSPVRKRPAMYIGSTDTNGLHHCVNEIIDNSIDEALAGFATDIWVVLNKDGSVTIGDNGRGIPVDILPKYKVSALEIVMTKLHAGGKFDGKAYKVSGGLHGVGSSVVNALSSFLKVESHRDGKIYFQEYNEGVPKKAVSVAKKSHARFLENFFPAKYTGTITTFKPDPKIFKETTKFSSKRIKQALRQRAYLVPKIHFHFYNLKKGSEYHFYFEGGLISLLNSLNRHTETLHEPILIRAEENEKEIEVALQYTTSTKESIHSYVNVINTTEGGTHVAGFRTAITRSLKEYAQKIENLKEKEDLTGDDTREGITAVVSVKMSSRDLQFEGQTKGKLGNSEIQPLVAKVVKEQLDMYLEEHPADARAILGKAMLALKARKAAKAAKDSIMRKGVFDSLGLPGKLADCQSKQPSESEIFIVEGPSAGGSAKQGRDRKFQAILPLGGKILNTEKARLDRIIEFEELKDLITALGMGIGEAVDKSKLRYHHVIIMTDADVDGAHICTLLLTFFYRHLPAVIEGGYLYIAQPPLYKISNRKEEHYVFTDKEREEVLAKIGESATIQRYKGLGEMNPEQLWETTMNPKNRILKKVNVEDAQKADQVFQTLMGSEVPPRKKFIQVNAKMATLDI
ncbi:MAG: DNA gyrase subunit B [Candidatus Shapirobacteria bacterium]